MQNKRFDTDYYVEGFATTFDKPYLLWEYEGKKYYEKIDRHALDDADLSDVIMQYDHSGTVFARNKMKTGNPPSLVIEPQEGGLFIAADLSLIDESRKLYESIEKGLIYQMSWAFTIKEESYNKDTLTRTILKVGKVYDISAVSIPANDDTEISARSYFRSLIQTDQKAQLEHRCNLLKLKILLGD